jgi:uncharacterized protein with HEPN domain
VYKAKLESILKMVEDVEYIVKKHGAITKALEDREGELALLMCLMQIGEKLNKLDKYFLEKNELLDDAKGAYSMRNFIAHDYDGVKLSIVEQVIRVNIPQLKEKILTIINAS